MIIVDTFVSGTLDTVDTVVGTFVNSAYVNLIQANSEVITLLFTLYVMLLGYQFVSPGHHFNLHMIFRKFITMLCVYALMMNWSLYDLFVYKIFTIEPGNIAKVLVSSSGQFQVGGIAEALDQIYREVVTASMELFSQVSFSVSGIAFIIYGILVFLIGSAVSVFALLLLIYAKMMMAVTLALGPIFILLLLWEPTKDMFAAWLRKLVTIALIPIITSSVLMLMLSVINVTLPKINVPSSNLQFYGIAPFLGLCLVTTMILAQVFRICSALGGGITLASLSTGASIAGSALQKSGVTPAAKAASKWAQKKAKQIRRNIGGR